MFTKTEYKGNLEEQYDMLSKQLSALLEGEDDIVANLSNASALLNQFLTDINWVGFYLMKNDELVLGPFQGLPACVRIPVGRGVCGTAVQKRETIVVEDVHQFPGHIACDARSNSEIVIPLIKNDEIIGVLDIDSPLKNRFTNDDKLGLEKFVQTLIQYL
ncbi:MULTISPECIES: GAF domain-containing protein [Ureibacillus]|jgi:L-methionine (R)-S-oxide reductase|uniref:GAF domain-containing protein n=1 Tax=Ureibacillus thermosphaericus TaxID=51173 RepID=A0A840PSE2_URETH|nr:GAF domain-containing protein [Ureibacillus thermosphaericus]MBB5148084.1 GAF domain-containing protein [Ureibacillus thermosphaericus]NKZ30795.1 GAF domain-containing protein [Ureibacillus thermosphaericus]